MSTISSVPGLLNGKPGGSGRWQPAMNDERNTNGDEAFGSLDTLAGVQSHINRRTSQTSNSVRQTDCFAGDASS